ncbi:type III secretion system (T3SS) inner membrane Yop/YscD-like protein [Frondihabitans sp. PhB188]|uniref:FHA domain-containing protein FhaB/FipA n=1 Tax=Frondihabitans sp. PhB188 TaxID=2485200 RepID=UPI000F47D087|nr:FHA domain-containing protein [Frondihabitans sp. PhB188]ROQ37110.1 type III secretion system (T3SS) inner membrane Yop/YscD-like protein [Frondihabitans sp. PhB188]
MTSELTLLVLRLAFIVVLWLFIFFIVYALRSDLFGQRAKKLPADQQPAGGQAQAAAAAAPSQAPRAPAVPAPAAPAPTSDVTATRLVITKGAKNGLEMPLGDGPLTIGRSNESNLIIRDDYTSTHHARLMLWNGRWVIQDLDSTNGTFVNGERISVPTPLASNTTVTIGTTSFELRR